MRANAKQCQIQWNHLISWASMSLCQLSVYVRFYMCPMFSRSKLEENKLAFICKTKKGGYRGGSKIQSKNWGLRGHFQMVRHSIMSMIAAIFKLGKITYVNAHLCNTLFMKFPVNVMF